MPLYLKQYGERRTGTNALRALIAANYDDVVVLMHILGDKHSPPAALDALWHDVQTYRDPAWEFVSQATRRTPAGTTRLHDHRQLVEMRRHAVPLAEAFVDGSFGYLVSIRNPYPWAVSLTRFLTWPRAAASTRLREACVTFNDRYRAWLPLLESTRRPAVLVRHEDLIRDAPALLDRIDSTLNLARSAAFHPIEGIARPAPWDDDPLPISTEAFDAGSREAWPEALTPEQRGVVTSTIDWGLMERFGYAPFAD